MRRYITICLFIVCAALQGLAEVIGKLVVQAVTDEIRVYKLWYDEPVQVWTGTLLLDNGRLGAMVYDAPTMENIQLNEETLWAGRPNNDANPNTLEYIPKVRQLVLGGKYLEAQILATGKMMIKTNSGMSYQSSGHLRIAFPGHARYTNYYRGPNLDSVRTVVCYTVDGVRHRREVITPLANQVVMMRLSAPRPGMITYNAHPTSPHQNVTITGEGDEITLSGVSSWYEGLKGKALLQGHMVVRIQGEHNSCADGVLATEKADEAIFYFSAATNFMNYKDITGNETERSKNCLHTALKHSCRQSLSEYLAIYKSHMDRVDLDLGHDRCADVTTDVRVQNFREAQDDFLIATYFHSGRHPLICSSQPGGRPVDL